MSVIVAVRVRPFNQREKDLNSELCIKMKDNQTILYDENKNKRVFAFDYSFWSHDNFVEEKNGLLVPQNQKYADQTFVYDLVGKQVLRNALDGYHCCLFAYGQTGSGKSYSMIGYGPNKGIVPKISYEIFSLIEKETSKKKWFEVNVSMLEIYNEKIQDLLLPVDKRPHEGLKVRQSKSMGVYVEQLSKHPVSSYEEIEKQMSIGSQHRTIASTLMNACSSRAHTIITIEFLQLEIINGKKVQRFSQINLVDLAGSEKFSKTGATGDRLKEGCSINQSLTVLGKVISNLADKAMGKGKNTVTPYRESSLTRILQNALGGNSKTLMICAISPSNNNYDETLSTLRYADQAKKIKCHAVVNESEADKKIRELQNENNELKELLKKLQKGDLQAMKQFNVQEENEEDEEKRMKEQEEMSKKIQDLEEMLKANNLIMDEYQKSFEERLKEEKEKGEKDLNYDYSVPHLTNLNEDQMLNMRIYHNFESNNKVVIGRGSNDVKPDIIIRGIGIQEIHAIIERNENQFFISPSCEEASDYTCLNGQNLTQKIEIKNLDRIALGFNTIFLFRNPLVPTPPQGANSEQEIGWEMAQMEIQDKLMKFNFNPQENLKTQSKYIEIESHVKKIEQEYQDKIEKMKQQHEDKLKLIHEEMINNSMQNDLIALEKDNYEQYLEKYDIDFKNKMEVELAKKDEFEKQYMKNFKENDKKRLEEKMYKLNPNVIEANLIAFELKRNIHFKLLINFSYVDSEEIKFDDRNKINTKVQVQNNEEGYFYQWDIEKFTLRYLLIRELLDQFYLTGKLPQQTKEQDPFWDPLEPIVLGEGFVKLMSLAYLVDNPNQLMLVGDSGQIACLSVNLIPVDEEGNELDEDHEIFDDFIDDPKDLFGKEIYFVVEVTDISIEVQDYVDLQVIYTLKLENENNELVEMTFETDKISGKKMHDNFNYQKKLHFKSFSQSILNYLLHSIPAIKIEKQKFESTPVQPMPIKIEKKKPVEEAIQKQNEKILMEKEQRMKEKERQKQKQKKKNCLIF